MKKLIRLELQKNNWKPYWITTSITTLVMLGFIYLIVLIPYLEPRDDDAGIQIFSGRDTVLLFWHFLLPQSPCLWHLGFWP